MTLNRFFIINKFKYMILVLKQENWDEFTAKLKIKYPQLTEDDLQHKDGMEDSMLRMIEYKLGVTKKGMQDIIEAL